MNIEQFDAECRKVFGMSFSTIALIIDNLDYDILLDEIKSGVVEEWGEECEDFCPECFVCKAHAFAEEHLSVPSLEDLENYEVSEHFLESYREE